MSSSAYARDAGPAGLAHASSTRIEIRWLKLDLKHIPQPDPQVDRVGALYDAATDSGNASEVERLYRTISLRLDEMEEFFLDNDADPRAILLEKVRLKLKKALQRYDLPPPQQQDAPAEATLPPPPPPPPPPAERSARGSYPRR